MTYKEVLKIAQQQCVDLNISEQTALMLLLELSEMESHNLYYEYDNEMDDTLRIQFETNIQRILKQEPLAHVLGYEYFYGHKFIVNENVLIPRPETEELVANVLADYDTYFESQPITLIDVGCGSGAIALALKKEESKLNVYASDISLEAVEVSKQNAKQLEVDVDFLCGDMLQPFIDANIKVDILVSNPPYIPQDETMESSVVDYEPHVALFGGDDGLKFYRMIFEGAHKLLNEKSILAFEMGYNQSEAMEKEARKYFPDAKMETYKDINGKDRMFFIYNNLQTDMN